MHAANYWNYLKE